VLDKHQSFPISQFPNYGIAVLIRTVNLIILKKKKESSNLQVLVVLFLPATAFTQ